MFRSAGTRGRLGLLGALTVAGVCTGVGMSVDRDTFTTKESRRRQWSRLFSFPIITASAEAKLPVDGDSTASRPATAETSRWYTTAWDDNWDRRKDVAAAMAVKKPQGKGKGVTRHLYLIRHGQYQKGEDDAARKLTELGRVQADLCGARLAKSGITFDKLHYSTMTRAMETSSLIAKHIPQVPHDMCPMLREGAPIPPVPPTTSGWSPSEYDFYADGARIEAAFRKHFYRADASQTQSTHEVIVCHANVIRYFVCRALQIPPEFWLRMSLGHCSITRVDIAQSGRVVVRSLGDVGHLEAPQQTFN